MTVAIDAMLTAAGAGLLPVMAAICYRLLNDTVPYLDMSGEVVLL